MGARWQGWWLFESVWNVELPPDVHTEDSVEAGLVQVDEASGLSRRGPTRVILRSDPVVIRLTRGLGVLCQVGRYCIRVVAHAPVTVDEMCVGIGEHASRGLQREEQASCPGERLPVHPILHIRGKEGTESADDLPLATCPSEQRLKRPTIRCMLSTVWTDAAPTYNESPTRYHGDHEPTNDRNTATRFDVTGGLAGRVPGVVALVRILQQNPWLQPRPVLLPDPGQFQACFRSSVGHVAQHNVVAQKLQSKGSSER